MEFLLEFPLIPLGAFVVLSVFFAYQLKLYLGEKKKNIVPRIPNLMTNATPLVLPAQQQSQAFMHKMDSLQKEQKKQAGKIQKGISFAQAFYIFSILFFFITTTTIFIVSRNKKLSFLPRADQQPTAFPTSFLPTATIPPQGDVNITTSPTNAVAVTPTITAQTTGAASSASPTQSITRILTQTPTLATTPRISPTKMLSSLSPGPSKAIGGILTPTTVLLASAPTTVPTVPASNTVGSLPSPTVVLLSQYGQYNPVVYPSPTLTPSPRVTNLITPTTQIPQAGLSFVSVGLLLISVTLLFVGFAL